MPIETSGGAHSVVRDDEYKEAIQSVIDDNMRTDVLGPGFCKVLTEHIPTTEKLKVIIATAIENDPTVKKAIEAVLEGLDHKRKSKWVDRAIGGVMGFFGTLLVAVLVALATRFLLPPSSPSTSPSPSSPVITQPTTTKYGG